MRSIQAALLFLIICSACAIPTCVEKYGSTRTTYTCSGFTTHEDFDRYVSREFTPDRYPDVKFVLQDSSLDFLPPSAFAGTRASSLVFSNVQVSSFPDVGQTEHPFHGLVPWLKRMEYSNGSTVPSSWALLQPLTKLHSLVFRNMSQLRLTDDFNSLPQSLKKLDISNCTIRSVDPSWLSQLKNLEELIVRNTDLDAFARSMLPTPTKLTTLDLSHNVLTSLPVDLTKDAPSLTTLNVAGNAISSFSQQSFEQISTKEDATVNLEANPLNCDCHARFLSAVPNTWTYPPCHLPTRLRGRLVKNIGISQLLCA